MKKVIIIFLIVGIAVCSQIMQVQNASAEKTTVIRFSHDLPPQNAPIVGINWWAKAVTERTEGRVKVQVFPASSLSTQQQAIQNLMGGVCDMAMVSITSHTKNFPLSSIVGLPGVGFPDETLEANTAHMNTYYQLLEKFPVVKKEYRNFGPVFFYMIYAEAYLMSKKVRIQIPSDLNGIKIGSNGIRMDLAKYLNAAPVFDIPPTAYEKLQTGVTQATFIATAAAHQFQLYEVTDYALDIPFGGGGLVNLINKDTWEKISHDDQQIMIELATEGSKRSHQAQAELASFSWTELKDRGMKVKTNKEERNQWNNVFKIFWDKWITDNEKAGVKEARDIFDFWKSASDMEWQKNNSN